MGLFNKKTTKEEEPKVVAEKAIEVKEEAKAVKAVKPVKSAKAVTDKSSVKVSVYGVLIAPLLTEKTASGEANNQYAFAIDAKATKNEVKKAVESRYGLKPVSVNVSNVRGKFVRFGQQFGKRKNWKKAIVTLPKGKSINVYEGIK
ncbi:MAG: 50S ribosomal protein L23 [Patescibacteria group bacterium]|jgi:large subunit ribosomal protein L23